MVFILKHFDTNLLKFSATNNSAYPEIKILWINEKEKNLFPLDLEVSEDGIASWLKHRTIPKNRFYVDQLLAKTGLNINRPIGIIELCKGLSLNDCYWVVEDSFDGKFEKYNLYENRFSNILALIAFTGFGSNIRSTFRSSPEFSTNGMLPKCWRRKNGKIILYKGGTIGASNTGNEPYSEYYAYNIAKKMRINAIPYKLTNWKGNLCSTCELFTSLDYSFMPIGKLIKKGGFEAVRNFYSSLGKEFEDALKEMIVFDAVICNIDRHYGNFGVLINSHTNIIEKPAPIFDNGNSLFNLAGSYWNNEKELDKYISTLYPSVYEDFFEEARKCLTPEIKEKLRSVLNFKFTFNSKIGYSNEKLKLIEKKVRERVRKILKDAN